MSHALKYWRCSRAIGTASSLNASQPESALLSRGRLSDGANDGSTSWMMSRHALASSYRVTSSEWRLRPARAGIHVRRVASSKTISSTGIPSSVATRCHQLHYDLGALLRLLDEVGFEGPVGLQAYGVALPATVHLRASMGAWRAAHGR